MKEKHLYNASGVTRGQRGRVPRAQLSMRRKINCNLLSKIYKYNSKHTCTTLYWKLRAFLFLKQRIGPEFPHLIAKWGAQLARTHTCMCAYAQLVYLVDTYVLSFTRVPGWLDGEGLQPARQVTRKGFILCVAVCSHTLEVDFDINAFQNFNFKLCLSLISTEFS